MAVRKKKVTRKKTSVKKKAVAKRKSTAMSNWEEQLAAEAEQEAERTGSGGGGNYISIQGGKFKCQGETLGDELDVIVLNSVYAREYYDRNFDPDDPSPPACFNVAADIKTITGPHETAPNPQNDLCAECEHDEWGSSGFGNSKACGAKVILCVMDPDGLGDEDYQPLSLRAGVNSMLNWDSYVKGLAKKVKRPSYAVVTTMYFDDEAANPILKFKLNRLIETKTHIDDIYGRREVLVDDMLDPPYNVEDYEAPDEKPTRGRRKKATTKKKRGRSRLSR